MNRDKNVERKPGYSQVCVWPGTIVGPEAIQDFEDFMLEEFNTHVQYLESITTFPDKDHFPETGGRHDVFFAVKNEDIGHFAIPRLRVGIRWVEDVLSTYNYRNSIYPERVVEYRTWNTEIPEDVREEVEVS